MGDRQVPIFAPKVGIGYYSPGIMERIRYSALEDWWREGLGMGQELTFHLPGTLLPELLAVPAIYARHILS